MIRLLARSRPVAVSQMHYQRTARRGIVLPANTTMRYPAKRSTCPASGCLVLGRRLVRATLVALFVSGCGFTIRENLSQYPINPGLPPDSYVVDLEASSVEYVGNNGPSGMEALEVRGVMGQLLQDRVRSKSRGRQPVPARFRLRMQVSRQVWPLSWSFFCIDLQVLGCPTGYAEASSQLELQVGNEVYIGRGAGTGYGGLYYNGFSGAPKAIALAMQSAVGNLSLAGTVAPSNP